MADNFLFVGGQDYFLSGNGVAASDTSITLKSFTLPGTGTAITMANFGDVGYGTLEPGTNRREFISWTGVTQNGDGSATLTGVTRGLQPIAPYTADSSYQFGHAGNSLFRITNAPKFYDELTGKDNDETVTGTWTFTNPQYPRMDAATPAPTDDEQLATKKYVDDTAFAGAPDASQIAKGVVEIATDAELASGAAAGSGDTTADLVAHAASFNETAAAGKVPVAESTGRLGEDWIGLADAGDIVYTDGTDLQRLPIGTASQLLAVNGAANAPEWVDGPATDVQIFTSSGTWTKPANISTVRVVCIGAGGSGGSGRRGASDSQRRGGTGGGGGAVAEAVFNADDLGATETITVATATTGGAAVTSNNTNGNAGANGGSSSFGTWLTAGGGGAGQGGGTSNAAGGGGAGVFTSASGTTGGSPNAGGANGLGSQGVDGNSGADGYNAEFGGASGGGTNISPNGNGMEGGGSFYAGPGGGGGGSTGSGDGNSAGGDGGTVQSYTTGGGASGGASGANPGTAGQDNADLEAAYCGEGGGGGGCAGAGAGGDGGNGGNPGGGGGGGGASLNGNNSGAGGDGGRGEVRVYSW